MESRGIEMLNPKQKRFADRMRELISEGAIIAKTEIQGDHSAVIPDKVGLHAWLEKVTNIVSITFGSSIQNRSLANFIRYDGMYSDEINGLVGILTGALDDLENGFLNGQEFIIAAEIFDSVLEQAKHLNKAGYKDPAAVLARVVLEDALKRLAREGGIDDKLKASVLNDELKKAERYAQSQWRLIQAWLDIGNSAAHGNFDAYKQQDIERLIDDIERFLATYFTS